MAEVIADPETDPLATYAVDPARVRALAARVVASGDGRRRCGPRRPMTGAPLAVLPVSAARDVEVAVDAARVAQRAWAATPVAERAAVLLRVHDLLLDRQPELLDLVQLESGKTRAQAFEELGDCAVVARHYARRGPCLLRDVKPRRHRARCSPGPSSTTARRESSASSRRGTTP